MRERGTPHERAAAAAAAAALALRHTGPSFSFIVRTSLHDDKTFSSDNIMILIHMSV